MHNVLSHMAYFSCFLKFGNRLFITQHEFRSKSVLFIYLSRLFSYNFVGESNATVRRSVLNSDEKPTWKFAAPLGRVFIESGAITCVVVF